MKLLIENKQLEQIFPLTFISKLQKLGMNYFWFELWMDMVLGNLLYVILLEEGVGQDDLQRYLISSTIL